MDILQACDLKKTYGTGEACVHALDGVSLNVEKGEFVAIVGTSGSGKYTLLHMLGGLDRPSSGKVFVDGKDIFSLKDEELTIFRRRKIGFVFQAYNLVPVLNVYENIVLMNLVSVGTINASLVIPREVFKSSILANASAIIGLHNHPSGNVKPSKEDMIVTRKLQKCGQLLGIELLDHIIVGGTNGKMLSFREEKMLNVTGRMDWER